MNDYIKAAFYTALFFAFIFGLATALTAFPAVTATILCVAATGLLFYSILGAIRSERKLKEIRARSE